MSDGDKVMDGLFHMSEYDIDNFAGPHWDKNLKTICANFDKEVCDFAAGWSGGEPVSLRTFLHWA